MQRNFHKRTWVGILTQVNGAETVAWVKASFSSDNVPRAEATVRVIYPAKAGNGFYPGKMDSGLRFSAVRVPRPLNTKEAVSWLLSGRLPIFVTVGEILRSKGQYPFKAKVSRNQWR